MEVLEVSSKGGRAEYEFTTTGKITALSPESSDTVEDQYTKGEVWGGTDTFEIDGCVKDFNVIDGFQYLDLKLDGEPVLPFHLKMDQLELEAQDGPVSYEIVTSGELAAGRNTGGFIVVKGNEARGKVEAGETQEFFFNGCLTGLRNNAACSFSINGEDLTEEPVAGNPPASDFH